MRTNIVWLALFMAVPWSMAAQRAALPPANQFYRTDVVPRIDIAIPADSLAAILTNVTSDYEYHATFAFTAPGFSVSGVEVGFRLRGNTSRSSGKKSFKISFNSMGQRLGSLTLPPDGEASWVDDGPSGMRIFQAEGHVLKAFKRD